VVLGSGPAGMAAACAALRAGARVCLVDSSESLGGQFWRHQPADETATQLPGQHGWGRYRQLRDELASSSRCRVIHEAEVWAVLPMGSGVTRLHLQVGQPDSTGRRMQVLDASRLVIATGAHDRTLPFPGWELPGVYTAGGAQALLKGADTRLAGRVLVAGAGPFLLPVAASIAASGGSVLAVLEASTPGNVVPAYLSRPAALVRAHRKLREGGGYTLSFLRHRIRYRLGRAVIAAHGSDRVTSVTVARVDSTWSPIARTSQEVEVDALCISHGFTPRLEIAVGTGCALTRDGFVDVDDAQRTSVSGVYAAGEVTGIAGVDAALAEGQIAGHAAADGLIDDPVLRSALRRRRVFGAFADLVHGAHHPRPGWQDWLTDETLICRCEEVSHAELTNTLRRTRSESLRSVKLTSRVGLGLCQGRVCGRTVEELMEAPGRERTPPYTTTDTRPVVAPVRLADLAAHTTTGLLGDNNDAQ
jgi:NADPH-dependent 2,4-dienoyl-CoA reductase/sulfur reductase-like enzyme